MRLSVDMFYIRNYCTDYIKYQEARATSDLQNTIFCSTEACDRSYKPAGYHSLFSVPTSSTALGRNLNKDVRFKMLTATNISKIF